MLKLYYIILFFFLFISCNKELKSESDELVDIDILNYADIAITKGNKKIVNAVASKLLKDDNNIYLKAEYKIDEISKIRSKLTQTIIEKPSSFNRIMTLASDLHDNEGNVRAEFFGKNQNVISSILYSDSAHINNRYNNMIAEGNVVIFSPSTNLMLLGNKVLWDNRAKRILSEENVTIVKVTNDDKVPCIQKSVGFESDMDLSNYIFYNIKGKIGEDCF